MVDLTRFAFPQGRFPQRSNQGTSLTDVLGAFGAARQRSEQQQLQRQQLERELEKQGELDDLVGLFTERPVGGRIGPVEGGRQVSEFPFDLSDEDKQSVLGQIMAINPDMGKNLLELRKTVEDLRLRGDENERKNVESQIKQAKAVTGLGGSIARSALQEDTLEGRQRVLRDAGRFMDAHGFPADKFFEMANEQDPDKLTSQLKQLETMSVKTEQALEEERFKLEQFQKEMQAQEKNANRAEAAFSILDTFPQEEIAQNKQLQFIQNLKNRLPTDRPPEGTDLARLGALIPDETLKGIQELSGGKTEDGTFVGPDGKLKTTVSNALNRQIATQFGGVLDSNGNVVGVDPEHTQSLSNMAADAADLLQSGQVNSIEQAVQTARSKQPEETFPRAKTFSGAAEQLEESILGQPEATQTPEATPENARAEVEKFRQTAERFEGVDLGEATGFVSEVIQLWNNIAGQFSPSFENKEVTRARMNLAILGREMIQFLAQNPRIPIAEQEVIKGIIKEPSAFNTPEGARVQIETLSKMLDNSISQRKQLLNIDLGPEGRDFKREKFEELDSLLRLKALTRRFDVSTPTRVRINQGTTPDEINQMKAGDLKDFVLKQDTDFLESLPPETKTAIKNKLGFK